MMRNRQASALIALIFTVLITQNLAAAALDYKTNPVTATDTLAETTWKGDAPAAAVDGIGGGSTMPFATKSYVRGKFYTDRDRTKDHPGVGGAGWVAPWSNDCSEVGAPAPEWPARLKLDYGKPTAVAKFAVYFPRQGNQDSYLVPTAPAALLQSVEVLRSDDGVHYESAVRIARLPWTCPQIIEIPQPKPARYYIFSVESMTPGNNAVRIYEIETYLDAADQVPTEKIIPNPQTQPERPAAGAGSEGTIKEKAWQAQWHPTGEGVNVSFAGEKINLNGTVRLMPDARKPADPWRADQTKENAQISAALADGWAGCELSPEPLGLRLSFTMPPPREGDARRMMQAKLKLGDARVRFLPAYHWDDKPTTAAWPGHWLPTCMGAIATTHGTLAVVPDTDRCRIGFENGDLTLCMFPDGGKASVLLMPIKGSWFDSYQAVVTKIDKFERVRQARPATEMAMGINNWLMQDKNWSKAWNNFRSFPATDQFYSDDVFFIHYGHPYSLPAMWQQHLLTGDAKAGEHARQMVDFIIDSPARVKEGPMKGGYYTQLAGTKEKYKLQDQAMNHWMLSHGTGGALWALLYHRKMIGQADARLDQAIAESAECLCRTQRPDGGWAFAYLEKDGSIPSADYSDSGQIWNIWALWQAGKALGQEKYVQAAERAKTWWINKFLRRHHFNGYWDDSNYAGVIWETREGYECSIAVMAFLEMGDEAMAVKAARDMATWVQTRVPSYREYETSYGLVPEQFTWPGDYYVAPQVGYSLQMIAQRTGEPFWEPFGTLCKNGDFFYEPETGASFFPLEAAAYLPLTKGPLTKTYWVDWCAAQDSSRTIWWLIDEINHRSGGQIQIDHDLLKGTFMGQPAKAWLPAGAPKVSCAKGDQINWMGYQAGAKYHLVIMNDDPKNAAGASISLPESFASAGDFELRKIINGKLDKSSTQKDDFNSIKTKVDADSLMLLTWSAEPK